MSTIPAIPDTTCVKEALEILRAAVPESIVNHSIRTYLLAKAYAGRRHIAFDEEGLAVAAAFHDLGLCTQLHDDPRMAFTFVGSRVMRSFLEAHTFQSTRISALCEAIEWHMQLLPKWKRGPEAGLLQVGAWMDVMRFRRWRVRKTARAITQEYPRMTFGSDFRRLLFQNTRTMSACLGLVHPAR